ncbi:MAG: SdpI family protein [Fulvivirga sp.]|nr:SdpI family protein [Fulvivirga sp.]
MRKSIIKEGILILITLLPLLALAFYYEKLPQSVPIHFNLEGEADNWADKSNLFYIFGGINLLLYFLLLIVPKIDPKGKIKQMGNKYFLIRLVVMLLISALWLVMLYTAHEGSISSIKFFPLIIVLFVIIFGNYMQSMKPNYFVGIRTPWSLEDEYNWKATHRFGGRLWMIGGVLILIAMVFLPAKYHMQLSLLGTLLLALIPAGYSYWIFSRQKKNAN